MILLLGHTGYIGQAFAAELKRRNLNFKGISRKDRDYTDFRILRAGIRYNNASFVINAAGFTGKPNVDACESQRSEAILGNIVFAETLANVCEVENIAFGHVSSGCIYTGAHIVDGQGIRLTQPVRDTSHLTGNIDNFEGFAESDTPNFQFRNNLACSFYSGTKALGEEVLDGKMGYVWRLRIPFDQFNSPRNYLTKLQTYPKLYNNINSLSHRGDFVNACLDMMGNVEFGVYNVVNPGAVTTKQVAEMIRHKLKPDMVPEYWASDEEFYKHGATTPRSNCILDTTKLLQAGIKMRPVEEALEHALNNWQP